MGTLRRSNDPCTALAALAAPPPVGVAPRVGESTVLQFFCTTLIKECLLRGGFPDRQKEPVLNEGYFKVHMP